MADQEQKGGNKRAVRDLRPVGGRLSLDFVNTMDPRLGPHPLEFIRDYDDLRTWTEIAIRRYSIPGAPRVPRKVGPPRQRAVLARARQVREALFRVLVAISAHRRPHPDDLDALADAYRNCLAHARLRRDGTRWELHDAPEILPLWLVTSDALDLLLSPELARVRVCAAAGECGWVFVDRSRNGTRRWCSMTSCGSRLKMRSLRRRAASRTGAAG